MPRLAAPPLAGDIVRLEPLSMAHAAGLREACAGPRDRFGWATIPTPETVEAYIERTLARVADGAFVAYAQRTIADDRIVGHTAYLAPRWWPDSERLLAVEIGGSWLAPRVHGTAVNAASKLLLLEHAFETMRVERVDLKTDERNARSRAAIQALGARFEGILRSWQPSPVAGEEGRPRDTAMHAIVAADWPEAKARLKARIAAKLAG